jgi:guanosine-3',5'-bis(diphosphate) 3'-pyrophosphohydrolase
MPPDVQPHGESTYGDTAYGDTALIQNVIERVQEYAPGADVGLVTEAYQYAALRHRGQVRKNGEDYLIHPLAVANILAGLQMDVETIATGLLHDTMEDTLATRDEIEQRFGKAVADMVEGVTKLSKLTYKGKLEEQAENFRKLVLAFGRDLRVIIVKVADRLHNMRTLEHHRPEKRQSIARETLDIYAPLVHRLGLELVKGELEDLCFRWLHPDAWAALREQLAEGEVERDQHVRDTISLLETTLAKHEVQANVTGRVKHLYSIWRKMQKSGKHLSDIHDLLAFRVLVQDRGTCYVALGFVHASFIPVARRMKDYIAVAKSNGYQSLHTTVIGPDGRQIEIQIRTPAMHRIAETGIAAHWRYKNGRLAVTNNELEEVARLRGFIEMARDIEDPADFMEAARSDLGDTIHVFTPARDVILLPEQATALDFAYHIHTEVGNRAAGAKVNGRMVPLRTTLKIGDTVEILTKNDAHPSRDWLAWANSHRALEKIRKKLRDMLADHGVAMGREILDGALRKVGSSLKRELSEKGVGDRLKEAGYKDLDALALEVVSGRTSPAEAARVLHPVQPEAPPAPAPSALSAWIQRVRKSNDSAIIVNGESDILVDYARCCRPMKGESIIGYITRGRGLSVHKADCAMVKGLDADRVVPVDWDGSVKTLHQGLLRVICDDRPGILAEITGTCASTKINLWRADMRTTDDDRAVCDLGIAVHDVGELSLLIKRLKNLKGVVTVDRAS